MTTATDRAKRLAPHAYALLEQVAGRVIDSEMAVAVDFAARQVARALAPAPMSRCHCGLAVGGPNPVRGQVGDIITGCATCTPERRRE